jgi:hypothetical protein
MENLLTFIVVVIIIVACFWGIFTNYRERYRDVKDEGNGDDEL